MLALQYLGNKEVALRELPMPQPAEGQVLIEVKASGLCGSEMHAFCKDGAAESNGGHEVAGIVAESGDSQRLTEGDRVGVHAVWGCGTCRWCMAGKYTYCDSRSGLGGAHAEFVAAPEHCCLKLDADVPFDVGVLLTGDGLGVPYHANTRLQTRGGEVVCVIGVGPIGLGNVLIQSFAGAEVIAVDLSEHRLEIARQLGAKHAINPEKDDPLEAVRTITNGLLADKCIEAVGRPETLALALKAVGKAGAVMAVGEQGEVKISPASDLIRRDITLMGSWFYHIAEYPAMVDLFHRGLNVAGLITHHFPLASAQEAYTQFTSGVTGKVMLEP